MRKVGILDNDEKEALEVALLYMQQVFVDLGYNALIVD
jgi:hypothetical protein